MPRISLSKAALKLLPMFVAFSVLSGSCDVTNHHGNAAEAEYLRWGAYLESDRATKNVEPEDDNPLQEAGCESHMQMLRNRFIETRHRALDKNACKTVADVSTFLMVLQECQKACPPDHLNQNGFTERIARNMQWLGSYNAKKCSRGTH